MTYKVTFFLLFCGRLTDEMREVLATMGSTLIKSVKAKDNWVFAGRAGTDKKSLYEKVSEPFHCSVIFPSGRVTKQRSFVLNGAEEKQNVVIDCKQNLFFSLTCQRAVNDEKTNIYEGWPELVEVGGCFPRTVFDKD